jgi:hypothetical protein
MVDVSRIDRVQLLHALWENADLPAYCNPRKTRFDITAVRISKKGWVGRACGKPIRARVFNKSNVIDPRRYDRRWGAGSFKRIVKRLRNNKL